MIDDTVLFTRVLLNTSLSYIEGINDMAQLLSEMAMELVQAQIDAGRLSTENMREVLQATHQNLLGLQASEASTQSQVALPQQLDWKKSISRLWITCLECGATLKQLTIRHLCVHDLTARSYRTKYGIPKTQPLSAKATSARRKKIAQQSRPWEKAPTYIKSQQVQARKKAVAKTKRPVRKSARVQAS